MLNVPSDTEEIEVTVGATLEVYVLTGGETVKDFDSRTFTVTFPQDD